MKKSKSDINRVVQSYLTKFQEYERMELDELLQLKVSGKIKGTYATVLENVIKLKSNINAKEKPFQSQAKKEAETRNSRTAKIRNTILFIYKAIKRIIYKNLSRRKSR